MVQQAVRPRRVKVSITLDPAWIREIDQFIAAHPGFDRSKVIDQALWAWLAKEQEKAMREQYGASVTPEEAAERAAWRRIQDAAALEIFSRPEHE